MFKIGDRVIAIEAYDDNDSIINKTGIVIHNTKQIETERQILVEFDEPIAGGHSGDEYLGVHGKKGHCWWVNSNILVLSKSSFTIKDRITLNCNKIYRF